MTKLRYYSTLLKPVRLLSLCILIALSSCNSSVKAPDIKKETKNNQNTDIDAKIESSLDENASLLKKRFTKLSVKSLLNDNNQLTKANKSKLAEYYNNKDYIKDNTKKLNKQTLNKTTTEIRVTTTLAKFQTLPKKSNSKKSDGIFAGVVTASKTTNVYPNTDGVITEVFFEKGQWMKKNAPLYQITTETQQTLSKNNHSALRQANAQLQSAQAERKTAQAMLETDETVLMQSQNTLVRYEPLIAAQAISEQAYQEAAMAVRINLSQITTTKALITQTAADIKTAKANVKLYKEKSTEKSITLSQEIVRAPIAGMVTEHNIQVGQKVIHKTKVRDNKNKKQKPTNTHLTLADINPIYVEISPTSEQYIRLKKQLKNSKKNHSVSLILANNQTYAKSGSISFNEVRVEKNNKNPIVRITFNNDDGLLLPNMKVKVQLPIEKSSKKSNKEPTQKLDTDENQEKFILLPKTAVVTVTSEDVGNKKSNNKKIQPKIKQYVFTVDKHNKTQIKAIETDGMFNKQVKVTLGIDENDLVITDSNQNLSTNSRVTIVETLNDK